MIGEKILLRYVAVASRPPERSSQYSRSDRGLSAEENIFVPEMELYMASLYLSLPGPPKPG
jgi:hypothetical protein